MGHNYAFSLPPFLPLYLSPSLDPSLPFSLKIPPSFPLTFRNDGDQAETAFCTSNYLAQPSLRMAAEARVGDVPGEGGCPPTSHSACLLLCDLCPALLPQDQLKGLLIFSGFPEGKMCVLELMHSQYISPLPLFPSPFSPPSPLPCPSSLLSSSLSPQSVLFRTTYE